MGARGPAPTPTPILEARGSWRAKTRAGEPKLPVKMPACPSWLSKEAKAEWRRVAKQLTAMRVVTEADRSLLTIYCEAWSEFVEAVAFIEQHGHTITTAKGYVVVHPMVGVKNAAADRLAKIGQQFGLSAASRARVKGEEVDDQQDDGKSGFFKAASAG